jgi:hypothetical protein
MMTECHQGAGSGTRTKQSLPVPEKKEEDYFRVASHAPSHLPLPEPYLQLPENDFPSAAMVITTSPASFGGL